MTDFLRTTPSGQSMTMFRQVRGRWRVKVMSHLQPQPRVAALWARANLLAIRKLVPPPIGIIYENVRTFVNEQISIQNRKSKIEK